MTVMMLMRMMVMVMMMMMMMVMMTMMMMMKLMKSLHHGTVVEVERQRKLRLVMLPAAGFRKKTLR